MSQRSPRGPAPTPEAWADQNGLQLEFDNEGQKIIYLDNEQADRLDMPPGVNWDAQSDGGGWVIYTGEYDEEARVKRGPAEYPVTERQEGMSLENMPDSWRQILGSSLK